MCVSYSLFLPMPIIPTSNYFCSYVRWWLQVLNEVQGFLRFLDDVYATFGLEYTMALSTRPESYLVSLQAWLLILCKF